MRNIAACLGMSVLSLALLGCAKGGEPPPVHAAPPSSGVPLTQAPGNGNQPPPATPVLAAAPGTPAGAPSTNAPLSTPDPLALGCTVDAHCLTHRCNVPAHKCAWPCQTDNDCMPGNTCIKPTCLPKLQ